MPRTDVFDIESPLRTLSTLSKHNNKLFMFLVALGLFMIIYFIIEITRTKESDS